MLALNRKETTAVLRLVAKRWAQVAVLCEVPFDGVGNSPLAFWDLKVSRDTNLKRRRARLVELNAERVTLVAALWKFGIEELPAPTPRNFIRKFSDAAIAAFPKGNRKAYEAASVYSAGPAAEERARLEAIVIEKIEALKESFH